MAFVLPDPGPRDLSPGDIVVGDQDGIVVVPQSEVLETLHRLPNQEDIERQIRDRVKAAVNS